MTLNVKNKNFLSLLRQLDVDIDIFPDKSFDSLFESDKSELNYFLDWFIDNISSDNALTESEVDSYKDIQKSNQCLSDDEVEFELSKYSPSYDDLEALNENYIINSLVKIYEELNTEMLQLQNISSNLDLKHGQAKKRTNHLREELTNHKRKLGQIIDEYHMVNTKLSLVQQELCSFNLNNSVNTLDLTALKNIHEDEEILIELFKKKKLNYESISQSSLNDKTLQKLSKLKQDCITSKHLSVLSQGSLLEMQYKSSKAQEFLSKIKDDSESYFTFDEVLNIWCDVEENVNANGTREVESMENKELFNSIAQEYDLQFHHFLSQLFNNISCLRQSQISEFSEFTKYIMCDIFYNQMLSSIINKSMDNKRECLELIESIYSRFNEHESKVKNVYHSLSWKNKKYQDFCKESHGKNALQLSYTKLSALDDENLCENNISINKVSDIVNLYLQDVNVMHVDLLDKLERKTTSLLSEMLCGPTNQIQIFPIELHVEFNKCEQLIAKYTHDIQRLLTEYINTKDTVSTSDRRKLLLWIDFLMNPKGAINSLKQLQEKSMSVDS